MTGRNANSLPWPLKVDRACFPKPAARLIEEFFQFKSLDSYRRNLQISLVEGRSYPLEHRVMNLHRLLDQKECLGLFATALIHEGFDCRYNLKTSRFGVNHFLFDEACSLHLPELLFIFDKQGVRRLLEQTAPDLLKKHEGSGDDRFDKQTFSFPHRRSLHDLHRCAIASMTKQPVQFESAANKILTGDVVRTFALPGSPSKVTIKRACAHLGEMQSIFGKQRRLSTSMLDEFIATMVRLAPTWVMGGMSPDIAAQELSRRIVLICPALFPKDDADARRIYHRNLLGRFIANYPSTWEGNSFKAYELLGPNMIDVPACHDSSLHLANYTRPFISNQSSSTWVRPALKALARIDPDILDIRHIVREGSRCAAWKPDISGLPRVKELINGLASADIYHPILKSVESAELLDRSNANAAIAAYICSGGKAARARAAVCLRRFPDLAADMVGLLKTPARTRRACAIYHLSTEELMRLRAVCKGAALAHMMGI